MTTNRYGIRLEHLGPDAEESDVVRYVEYLEQAGIEPGDNNSMQRAWEVFCSSGSFEAAAAELARVRCETGKTDFDRAELKPTTYTVRPLGASAWESGLTSLEAALSSAREAHARGLQMVVIVNDATGEIKE